MIGFILTLIVVGLVFGFLARAIVPGKDDLSIPQTILLGIVGSFVGGFLGYALFGKDLSEGAFQPAGFFGSLIGSVIALVVFNKATGRKGHRRRAHV